MKLKGADSGKTRKGIVFAIAGAVVILTAAFVALYTMDMFASRARRAEVAARGAQVMPFDLDQTMHVFQKLEDGGLQRVVVKDPSNKEQIALIQAHLKEESERFRKGDFSDPGKIHGEDMPGLAELKAGAGQIDVRYAALRDGAQVWYKAKDPKLVMAIHHWFDAQLSDHGHHASDPMQ
jgi:hypothetical protein